MSSPKFFGRHTARGRRAPRARLQVELLETRNVLSTTLGLTPLVQVPELTPPLPTPPSSPTVFPNSEVEPQVAVDPNNPLHVVGVWQQDRYRSVGGARALVAAVSNDGGATWSVAAIPGFNSTDPAGAAFARYTDPWVTITRNGDVYATALAITPVGPFPGHTAALVVKSIDGGFTWSAPTTLIRDDAPPGTDPIDLANDKESVTADPTDPTGKTVYIVWDRLNHPSDQQNTNAFHGVPFREDMMFARTTDGGVTWDGGGLPPAVAGYPASDVTNFKANESAFGNQIVVQPDGTLLDLFTHATGSGNQATQADQNHVGVLIGTKHGDGSISWSPVIDGPAIEVVGVTDPDTGAPVRDGDPLISVAFDPQSGNLYAVWADARFSSKFTVDGVAFSMSKNGGQTWSDPIKINQTPTNIPAGDQQAFTPTVAVNSDGTVAVTYYDFRNNDASPGLLTDYWLVHASSGFTNPASWASDEKRLTSAADGVTGQPFNMENAAPTSRGLFLGDYEGLAAAGSSFYAFFAEAGADSSDPSNIYFRDPPPETDAAAGSHAPAASPLSAAPPTGDSSALPGTAVPSPANSGGTQDSAAWSLTHGLPEHGTGPTGLLSAAVGESSMPVAKVGLDRAAVDQFFTTGVGELKAASSGSLRSASRARDAVADQLTDDWSLDGSVSDIDCGG